MSLSIIIISVCLQINLAHRGVFFFYSSIIFTGFVDSVTKKCQCLIVGFRTMLSRNPWRQWKQLC